MDSAWRPTWDAEVIEWEDFGLPSDPDQAARAIVAAFKRAKAGEKIEVGCRGGLGRTGTVLACMAILSGVSVAKAVEWVRGNYRSNAIEGARQEHWIEWFAHRAMKDKVGD
jgi:protein-tyrosine phosphatase